VPYYLFPKHAAAYRIVRRIAADSEDIEREKAIPKTDVMKIILANLGGNELILGLAQPEEERKRGEESRATESLSDWRVAGTMRKMKAIQKKDRKLFDLVTQELEKSVS
jgi:hypothetical protein